MSKFNATGQVAGIGNSDAQKAKASGAVTDAGYLGGTTWLKTQVDLARDFYHGKRGDGYERIELDSPVEGLAVPDGEFDFFDLTYNLTLKGVTDAIVSFLAKPSQGTSGDGGHFRSALPKDVTGTKLPLYLSESASSAQEDTGDYIEGGMFGAAGTFSSGIKDYGGAAFIVNQDYKDCGPWGNVRGGGFANAWGTNPPPTDYVAGQNKNGLYTNGVDLYHNGPSFWQYKDSSDAKPGLRYIIGLYDTRSAISSSSSDNFVIKSMSINTTTAGVSQLVLHCRKTEVTSGYSLQGLDQTVVNVLKINL